MDYTAWAATEMRHNPNPNNPDPNPTPFVYNPNYPNYYPQNPNSDPYKPAQYIGIDPHSAWTQPLPPGVDPPYVPPPVNYGSFDQGGADAVSYYQDPNWAAAAATITQLGPNSFAPGVAIPKPASRPRKSGVRKPAPPKKPKIIQTAYCEVCKIVCNTNDVLEQHKLGRKHKKNVEKLRVPATSAPAPVPVPTPAPSSAIVTALTHVPVTGAAAPTDQTIIGPEENPEKPKTSKAQKTRKKAAISKEDLETKRRKIVEEGASADSVRACAICNVVCNSETVFNYHLAGQKHAAMVKKHNAKAGASSAT